MFPFHSMPGWAQLIGEGLPLTHFLRIMLKGSGLQRLLQKLLPELWPMGLFLLIAGGVALKRYRQTFD